MPVPPPLTLTPAPLGLSGGRAWYETMRPSGAETWGERLLTLANTLMHTPVLVGRERGGAPTLASAVAAIVGIAAQRAQAAGELSDLRASIERALDEVQQPSEEVPDGAGLPCIADAEVEQERDRLLSLMRRQGRR